MTTKSVDEKASGRTTPAARSAEFTPIDLGRYDNWPDDGAQVVRAEPDWLEKFASKMRAYPTGAFTSWGVPFAFAPEGADKRAVVLTKATSEVTVSVSGTATHISIIHFWEQLPPGVDNRPQWGDPPREGVVVAEYVLRYADGSEYVQPIRGRFEINMVESPGPPWLAQEFVMLTSVDPQKPSTEQRWGESQMGLDRVMGFGARGSAWHYALENPHPDRPLAAVILRAANESPLIVLGMTLFRGTAHPLRHLPRRTYALTTSDGKPARIAEAKVDLGTVTRIEETYGPAGEAFLESPMNAIWAPIPERGEDLVEAAGAEDATLTVKLAGAEKPLAFLLGETFKTGASASDGARLEVLGRERRWLKVRVIDVATGKPTPVRIHFSGARGEYYAPYGHQSQVNTNWFEDYGPDLRQNFRSYAYVDGEFTTDLPVGDVYVEIRKGFEYEPIRRKVRIGPDQQVLEFAVGKWADWRSEGWVTADTHVHFVSPQTAWLEAQGEGVNVVNLLASQWGRLFTNAGDYRGRVGVVEDDTIVYVGTENRNHMLGHMSMLGTKGGLPVFPMCCGGPTESYIGDPDFRTLAEWAIENRRLGGVVIRPHFPYCGYTEDPVPIIMGVVDALEMSGPREANFPVQEWYRYLNNGYRVAVCGGTDKMDAAAAIGWTRTYAKLDPRRPFDYDAWVEAVRAGRTFSTTGALIDIAVDGKQIGDTIRMKASGGTVEVAATASSSWPLARLEIVVNGRVVASREAIGARSLEVREQIAVARSGWVAARCVGDDTHPGRVAAHTSPVYVTCGDDRPFDGPAMEHMLALVEGGIEYLNTLATAFDESSRRRMVKVYADVRKEIRDRLKKEGKRELPDGPYSR